ncbi:signal peptidase I [Flavobacterium sp. GT3R68]|uniref:signal peptidase I n=1 Tax=Flavobacterium sp. GT3R68 TaxID=2594437 RepID=UPI000F8642B9|nr:signal peptidase I [Flavobacterium sp. GT3R68]RTY93406.1 signal peptidase I [Flavobacterium sp. GSN2]TRW92420.1 signal peptidase I [Flavobacterium sp. GT3R68]
MTLYQWFVFFLILQIVHFLGTWKLYEAAGRKRWEAAIPIYNAIVLMKIINRPAWWTILLFIPVINLIMFPVVWVETLRSFGKNSTLDTVLAIVTLGFYVYYVNYTQKLNYIPERSLTPTNKTADTISSLLFAIVVATLVHTYFIQPYTIPSASLEKTLLIGDFLFVSKVNYGARVPMTTIAAPMVHDSLPLTGKLSYTKWPQLPYFRLPGFEKIKNNDIVVFNWPRDTLDNMYHPSNVRIDKPRDKKTNYVKRCVGIPGDSLAIKDGIVFINGKELILPERAKPQYSYKIGLDGKTGIDFENLLKDMNVTDGAGLIGNNRDTLYIQALTFENAARMKNVPGVTSVTRIINKGPEDGVFPDFKDTRPSVTNNWSGDNFGPIYIPQVGKTVTLDLKSLPFYKIIITEYEGNDLKVIGDDIYVNGKKANTYTFKQNYYWMMGDNRHNSLDARYFGYTPEDHIVGKPTFIWMSLDPNGKGINKVRWDRVFTTVSGEGQPYSYFKFFLIALAAYFGISFLMNKRKEKKQLM